ncbi:MAG TPA: hypothetical protein VM656_17600 [Pyrinomonadaceae bacterium]|nr:hypothetical protein [Pyrinomonadaceae bacterium]
MRRKKFLSCIALRQKSLSFTPGFSLVSSRNTNAENRFNGLPFFRAETVKTVPEKCPPHSTRLKPGVNEKIF